MNKKSLEEKIVSAVVWLALLAIIYFVIGIFLITDGLGFNSEKVYELLKDTLTLMASFLTPAIAFLLFNDWRETHRSIRNEKEILDILNKLKLDSIEIGRLVAWVVAGYDCAPKGITNGSKELFQSLREKSFRELGAVEFSKSYFDNTGFHAQVEKIRLEQHSLLMGGLSLFLAYKELESAKNNPCEDGYLLLVNKRERAACADFQAKATCYFNSEDNQMKVIKELARAYRI